MTKKISILGATGSIGSSTLRVLSHRPEAFEVDALVAGQNVDRLAQISLQTGAKLAVVADERQYGALKEALSGTGVAVAAGRSAVLEAAARPVDTLVSAMVGAAGLEPTVAAIQAGSDVALANKESLVCAGRLVRPLAETHGVRLLPMDSEHNAVFQVLEQDQIKAVDQIILTASGGPFRRATQAEMKVAMPEAALQHPNWSMGQRITIDSATMMNKGFELIEAFHLFGVRPDQLDVLVHPQSIIHGMVRYTDGALLAHMGDPDMCGPIAYCLHYPERQTAPVKALDLAEIGNLYFEKPDLERFPALGLARRVMELGDGAGAAFNAADEVAVAAFLNHQIGFLQIVELVQDVLDRICTQNMLGYSDQLEGILQVDAEARRLAQEMIGKLAA